MPTAAKKAAPKKAAPKATTKKENTMTAPAETESTDATMQKARSAALARIREENRDRYNEILVEEAKALGIDWKPRPSAKDRARQKLQQLLAENPELKDELV